VRTVNIDAVSPPPAVGDSGIFVSGTRLEQRIVTLSQTRIGKLEVYFVGEVVSELPKLLRLQSLTLQVAKFLMYLSNRTWAVHL
jgi:hypothetical protein